MDITIPNTVEEVGAPLAKISRLITAKRWERASILAAFVKPDLFTLHTITHTTTRKKDRRITAEEFAALGIVGLTDARTVSKYVNRWIERYPAPNPGETITLPTERWISLWDQEREKVRAERQERIEAVATMHASLRAEEDMVAQRLDTALRLGPGQVDYSGRRMVSFTHLDAVTASPTEQVRDAVLLLSRSIDRLVQLQQEHPDVVSQVQDDINTQVQRLQTVTV